LNYVHNSIYTDGVQNNDHELEKLITLYGNSIEGKIWRGSHSKQHTKNNRASISTGYKSLNKQLHGNGWPLGTVNEFGVNQHGIGELRLLMPALKSIQKSSQGLRHIVLIAPPYLPFAPALAEQGIDLNFLTIVQTKTLKDSLWSAEQSLAANCCAAVICWTGTHKINNHDLRRLQLVSEKTQTWSVLFRHSRSLEESSTSGLRIQLRCHSYSKLELSIIKQPQGWGGQACTLSLAPHYENWQRLPTHLLPVYTPARADYQPKKRSTGTQSLNANQSIARPRAWHASVSVIAPLSALKTV